ncbi:MAG: NepR family anti-sigma factor [Methylocystis sp.]|uniref:NepR family anti-sigma factor n=1 Tax=Methylocystis sp. TaxID=1911079 RepID=UPI003DA4C1D3
MVKNSPENAVARAQSDEDKACSDGRRFPAPLPRSLAAVAAGLGVGAARVPEAEASAGVNGLKLRKQRGNPEQMRHQDIGDVIGKELQNLYDDLVAQPVPDRFLNLLNQLEKNMVSSGRSVGAPGERE